MKVSRLILLIIIACYGLLWAGGIISYLFLCGPPSDSRWTAPLFLCLAASISLALTHTDYRGHLAACGLIGLVAEIIGVSSGFPFGRYTYTQELQPLLLDVPVVIGCAWLVLFAYVKQMVQLGGIPSSLQYLCGAIWMVFLDLLIDPLASGPLGYWIWEVKGLYFGIPLINFFGWFIVSLGLFLIFRAPWPLSRGAVQVGFSIVIFFSLIALGRGLTGAFSAGIILILFHFVFFRQSRVRDRGI
jgi:putative membrane protein